jgi:Phage portal protein
MTTGSSSSSPSRVYFKFQNERSIVTSIYTRLSIDVAGLVFQHVKVDDDERYTESVDSFLNTCLLLEPNLDQGPRHFRQDIVTTLIDEGVVAICPIDTDPDPIPNERFDIKQLRVGKIVEWFPADIKVNVYNQDDGKRWDLILPKRITAVVENPFYSVMNEPNSTLQRLLYKLMLLDKTDEKVNNGKLDIIIQLPYITKTEAKQTQAENRRQAIEDQIANSPLGIAYIDGTEKITQLNRPVENNLLKQVEYLVKMLYDQLGITAEILNGTATEEAMTNYYARTIKPFADAIKEAMMRAFIGPVGYLDNERIMYFRDPFELVPVTKIAEAIDVLARNEIVSSNEGRAMIGKRPVKDPKANELRNSNMPQPDLNPAQQQPPQQQKELQTATANPQKG